MNKALSMQACSLAKKPTIKEYSMVSSPLSGLANTFPNQ